MLDTGIDVREGQIYTVSVRETSPWQDASVDANPDGVEVSDEVLAMKWARSFRQLPQERYLKVCGVIGDLMNEPFPIGAQNTFVAPSSGRLYLFANDVPGMHANNSGTAEITVTLK